MKWFLSRLSEPSSLGGVGALAASVKMLTEGGDVSTAVIGILAGLAMFVKKDPGAADHPNQQK